MYLIKRKVMQLVISLSNDVSLLVLPETNQVKDVHPLLINYYSIYCCNQQEVVAIIESGELLNCYAEHFMGRIKLGHDPTSFKYMSDEQHCLPFDDVVEVIKAIDDYRNCFPLWVN
jgi:hypothetical protein